MFTSSATVKILLGGVLRYVNPNDWSEVRLDLDNGASGDDKEYWRQDDTRFPLPEPEQNFEEFDIEDGGDLISSRMPRRDITLVLLITGTSKRMLDDAFRDLYKEINRIDNCIEYKPESSAYPLYYKTYQYSKIDQSDYFIHKDRSDREFYAYDVTIIIPCFPYADANWEKVDGVRSVGLNDSFELRVDDDFDNWIEGGGDNDGNLLTIENCSFEGGTIGDWTYLVNCVIANDAANGYWDTHSLKMTIPSGGVSGYTGRNVTAKTAAGSQYTFAAKLKSATGRTYRVLMWDNIAGSQVGADITADGTWQTATVTATYDAGSTDRKVYLLALTDSHAGDVIYWDSCILKAGASATPPTGACTVTADIANYRLGGVGCKITDEGSIEDEDFLLVEELDHFNAQLFVKKIEPDGTAVINFDVKCYKENDDLIDTLHLMVGVDAILGKWMDLNVDHEPVISPSDTTDPMRWPEETAKCKRYIEQTGTAVIVLDTLKMADTEYIPGYQLDGAYGLVFPPDTYKGDVPALMDIYFKDMFPPGEWIIQNSYVADTLRDICALDTFHVYAVGDNGTVIKWNGSIWITETSGTTERLRGVDVLDATHIWAVGDNGKIIFGNGTTWVSQGLSVQIFNITNKGMENWTGNDLDNWDEVENGVSIVPCTYDKHSGSKSAAHVTSIFGQNGSAYQATDVFYNINPYRNYLINVWECSGQSVGVIDMTAKVWIGFYNSSGGYLGYKETLFTSYAVWTKKGVIVNPSDFPTGTAKIKIRPYSFISLHAGMTFGTVLFDDVTMVETSYPQLYAVKAIASDNVVAVGEGGSIYSFDGATWTQREVNTPHKFLSDVTAVDATHIWAVGEDGTILFSADSINWTPQTSGISEDLFGVYALDSTHVWAVGNDGRIIFYNGTYWTNQVSPVSSHLRSVWAADTTHVWAVGLDGVLLFFDGDVWVQLGSGVTDRLLGVSSAATDEIWISGDNGLILYGINTADAMVMTNLIVGQRKKYSDDFNPVRNALGITQTISENRQGQYYRAMAAGATEDWLINIGEHEGRYLLSIGACVSAGTVDQVLLTFQLKTLDGDVITTSSSTQTIDLSDASGHAAIQYFREIGMLDSDERYSPIDIPTHYVSEHANLFNMAQSILLTAGALGANFLWIDCLTLIPIDRAFVELNSWTYNGLIFDSHGGVVLASLDGSLDSAMVYDGTKWGNAPRFYADPLGVNITVLSSYKTGSAETQDYKLSPRLDMFGRYRPRFLLVETREEDDS